MKITAIDTFAVKSNDPTCPWLFCAIRTDRAGAEAQG